MKILIVEDDDDLREVTVSLLESWGHEVSSAANGREGIDALLASNPTPDVILLDLMMPVMDGWDFRLAQRGRPQLVDIPTIIVTAMGRIDRRDELGDVQILAKPVTVSALDAAMSRFKISLRERT
jgi:CheY-like chemotaxis protein